MCPHRARERLIDAPGQLAGRITGPGGIESETGNARGVEKVMPQDSGPEPKGDPALAAAAARVLDEVKAEPVPEPILELAQKLDRTLQAQRKKAITPAQD